MICDWDPYNAVIVSEMAGKISFDGLDEGVTYREESDEQTGFAEKVVIETRDKTKNPAIQIVNSKKEVIKNLSNRPRINIMQLLFVR